MSMRHPCFKSTSNPFFWRKSAPIIGMRISAMTKIHWNTCCRHKSYVSEPVTKVVMQELLIARMSKQSCLRFCSVSDKGMTLTSVPVLIRNWQHELAFVSKSK